MAGSLSFQFQICCSSFRSNLRLPMEDEVEEMYPLEVIRSYPIVPALRAKIIFIIKLIVAIYMIVGRGR